MSKNTNLAGQPILCQLISFLPRQIVDACVAEYQSDRYYKTMSTFKQLVFLLYGVVTKTNSLNSLCKNLYFLEDKLIYLGITSLPAVSTLSDANAKRKSEVFEAIYHNLYTHYKSVLNPCHCSFMEDEIDMKKVSIFDSSTITLFVDVFKGAGRNTLTGKKKGGLKIHSKMPMSGFVPDLVYITEACCNDKTFLGQLDPERGAIYVFDKGYVKYEKWNEWTKRGVYYVTRLNENAEYSVLSGQINHISTYANGGVISDQIIMLQNGKTGKAPVKARLIVWKDPISGRVLQFVSNMFDYHDTTIIQLYKYRWNIEVVFKRLKQNFELGYFYSDSMEGIKTQVWVALIANLLFSVIHRQCKEAELFTTIVSLAAINMGSYISLIKMIKSGRLSGKERNIKIIQLDIFATWQGGTFQKIIKPP